MPRNGTMRESYLSYNGPFESGIITTTKTPSCVVRKDFGEWMVKCVKNIFIGRKVGSTN
jgi:hypothetical protein